MKTISRPKKPLPQRAVAAFDRVTEVAAPHALLLILALVTVALFQRL
jgi:hypothetical protein